MNNINFLTRVASIANQMDESGFYTAADLYTEALVRYAESENNKPLNKPFRTPGGPKKFSVYVKGKAGRVKKVNFGDPNMEIKRDNPERRKNFRARHHCENPGPKDKAKYWSCKMWSGKNVSDITSSIEMENVRIAHSDTLDINMNEFLDLLPENSLEKPSHVSEDSIIFEVPDDYDFSSHYGGDIADIAKVAYELNLTGMHRDAEVAMAALVRLAEETDEMEREASENKPTNPELWSKAKEKARSKFDVYPSAYANGWAAKWYRSQGGGWHKKGKNDE